MTKVKLEETAEMKIDSASKAIALIQQLKGGLCDNLKWEDLRKYLHKLITNHPWIFFTMNTEHDKRSFFRGRISDNANKFNNISEILHREAKDIRTYGRCNIPKQSIYYGSSNIDTVLSEISPEIGEFVHISISKIKDNVDLHMTSIGDIDHARRYGRGLVYSDDDYFQSINNELIAIRKKDKDVHLKALLVDAFLSDVFSQKAYTYKDYKLTSALCDLIYFYKDEENRNDGVCYPSVKHRGGINFAIESTAFKKNMLVESCLVIKIIAYYGYGIYKYVMVNESKKIQNDGTIVWSR